jgi:superkiller protein 3
LASLLLAIPPASAGQATRQTLPTKTFGIIQGRVLPANGKSRLPAGITATLTSRDYRDLRRNTEVTSAGHFEFRELDRGDYSVRIESPGYSSVLRNVVIDGWTGQTVSLSITLGEPLVPTGVPPKSGSKTVSVQWLSIPPKARREMEEAEKASQEGEWEKSIQHLEKALEIHPHLAEAHTKMAALYMRLDRQQRAVECLEKAIEVNPDDAPSHRNLGMLYLRERQYSEAGRHPERARKLDPEEYGTLSLLGDYHQAMGDHLRALAFYLKVYEVNPDSYRLLRRIMRIHSRFGLQERSLPLLQEFNRRNPEHRRASRVRGMIRELTASGSPPGS